MMLKGRTYSYKQLNNDRVKIFFHVNNKVHFVHVTMNRDLCVHAEKYFA